MFRELSFFLKRLERRAEAAALWEEWIGTVAGDDLTPYIELAKYHEWHTLRPGCRARLDRLGHALDPELAARLHRDEMQAALQHRLLRLERKLAGRGTGRAGRKRLRPAG